jgi:hypothetical protein
MTQVLVILDSNTLSVVDWYFSDSPIVPVTPRIRLEVPEGLTWDVVKGQKDPETGEVTLVADPSKVSQKTEAAWSQLRNQRDSLLTSSDWRVLPFAPLTPETQQAWVTYRQALRDLPGVTEDPQSVSWPSPPQ